MAQRLAGWLTNLMSISVTVEQDNCLNQCHEVVYCNYSELSLNGHLPKTDITFGPGCLYIIPL